MVNDKNNSFKIHDKCYFMQYILYTFFSAVEVEVLLHAIYELSMLLRIKIFNTYNCFHLFFEVVETENIEHITHFIDLFSKLLSLL